MRLIDADALQDEYVRLSGKELSLIDDAPTVDIDAITESHERIGYDRGFSDGYAQATSEVKHGHWITWFENEDIRQAKCSECGMMFTLGKGRDIHYCGNCGAYMGEKTK